MKKISNLKKYLNSRYARLIYGILILIIIVISLVSFYGYKTHDPYSDDLIKMGKEFYETFYYDQIKSDTNDMETFLKQYEEIGIKVNLNILSKYNGNKNDKIISKFVNSKTGNPCNQTDTMVIIYPHKPYDKYSYSIKYELSCSD